MLQRKIVHIDMDAFYASVEQRDSPALRGRPVVVAWHGVRSVVCAASYEARKYGVHSAMPVVWAERLCPHAIFIPPDFPRYRSVSRQVREIFSRYTDLIEPLSLDEAYLDVTVPKVDLPSATAIARTIRRAICAELHLTASAGVAANKVLAKIASDWRKPDGLFVIRPSQMERFLESLPVERLPGVGKVMRRRLREMGVETVGQMRVFSEGYMEQRFGRWGLRLHQLSRGIDEEPVRTRRPTLQVSCEDTFDTDLALGQLEPHIRRLAGKTWVAAQKQEGRVARKVVLKLKTADFHVMTRSRTLQTPPTSKSELADFACALRAHVDLPEESLFRLVGVGLAGFVDRDDIRSQADLFDRNLAVTPRVEPHLGSHGVCDQER